MPYREAPECCPVCGLPGCDDARCEAIFALRNELRTTHRRLDRLAREVKAYELAETRDQIGRAQDDLRRIECQVKRAGFPLVAIAAGAIGASFASAAFAAIEAWFR